MLRGAEARTSEALIEAIGRALSAVTATDVSGFVGHCDYRATARLRQIEQQIDDLRASLE
jgi:hypothetical protein